MNERSAGKKALVALWPLLALLSACGVGSVDDSSDADADMDDLRKVCPSDGNPCTQEQRVQRQCVSRAVADGTACPGGSCVYGMCIEVPAAPLPPSIGFTSPAAGAAVSGLVTVSGSASDESGLARVELSVDAGAFAAVSGTASWSFLLDTTALANGAHQFTARATGTSGLQATAQLAIQVSNAASEVTVTVSPSNATISASGSVQLTATVSGSSDTAVTWSVQESAGCGTVSQTGLYAAPPAAASCHVLVQSHADPTRRAVASLTVLAPVGPSAGCAAAPLRSTGTVYYFCDCATGASSGCVAGNDSTGSGSAANPYRSFQAAMRRFASMNAGDTVALCRGGAWDITDTGGYLENPNCRAGAAGETNPAWPAADENPNTCDFRDYVPGAHPEWAGDQTKRPVVNHSGLNVFFTRQYQGARIWNLDLRAPGREAGSEGVLRLSGQAYTDVCNVRIHMGNIGVRLAGQYGTMGDGHDVVIRHSQIEECGNMGMLGSSRRLTVDSSYFLNSGTDNNYFTHAMYLTALPAAGEREDYVITNNEVYNDASNRASAAVVLHGGAVNEGTRFENNYVHGNLNAWAVAVSGGWSATDGMKEAIFRRNRITTTTGALVVSMCQDCLVEDNILTGYHANAQPLLAIAGAAGDPTDLLAANVTVRNNTIFNGYISVGTNWDLSGANARGLVMTNNAIWNDLSGACINVSAGVLVAANAGNWCHSTTSNPALTAGQVFVGAPSLTDKDGANADLRPAEGSPLAGAAVASDALYWSPLAIGVAHWSATDPGVDRVATGALNVTGAAAR